MKIPGWRYYNHAALPTCSPHEVPDTSAIDSGDIWIPQKLGGKALLSRWTTNWDCGYETNFWYVIKDTPFNVGDLKAKRRYEITKGKKNFRTRIINPLESVEDIYRVQSAAYQSYPLKYRPSITIDTVKKAIEKQWDYHKVYGAYFQETGLLCGYAVVSKHDEMAYSFNMLRVDPEYEKYGVNAALVECVLRDNEEILKGGGYINDGARNILHETHFQDYLEKYFNFRKAYCKLNVIYNPRIQIFIKVLYLFRGLLKFFGWIPLCHKINGILLLEHIRREDSKRDVHVPGK